MAGALDQTMGAGNGTGITQTITITTAATPGAMVQLFLAATSFGGSFPDATSPLTVTDTAGGSYNWSASGPHPIIGDTSVAAASGVRTIMVISAIRSGAALAPGDVVTVTWDGPYDGNSIETTGVMLSFLGLLDDTVSQTAPGIFGVPFWFNGDNYPAISANNTGLSWAADLALTAPDLDAAMLVAAVAYPAGTFSPFSGSVVADVFNTVSLTVALTPSIAATTPTDPGGTWGAASDALVANYQFVSLSAGFHAWQRL